MTAVPGVAAAPAPRAGVTAGTARVAPRGVVGAGARAGTPLVEIVIPVHNEEADLERSVRRLHAHLLGFPFATQITVADNASTDATWPIARRLGGELTGVGAVHLDEKGRGRALRVTWTASRAPVVAYMDVDLSTDLGALLPLVAPLVSGHSDLAIGSRLLPGSQVVRGPRRELVSRAYNLLLRAVLRTRVRDAQCGFKAARTEVARRLLPRVADQGWFLDTELLVLAECAGLRIHEVPVDWRDDPDSRVDIVTTALADLRGVVRLRRALASGGVLRGLEDLRRRPRPRPGPGRRALRFACVGVLSTVAYAALYWVLRAGMTATAANALALLVTAVGNTAANRRVTFGVCGRRHLLRHHAAGLAAFGVALGITTGAVVLLAAADPGAGRAAELAVLTAANVLATVVRFLLLLLWVGGGAASPRRAAPARLRVPARDG